MINVELQTGFTGYGYAWFDEAFCEDMFPGIDTNQLLYIARCTNGIYLIIYTSNHTGYVYIRKDQNEIDKFIKKCSPNKYMGVQGIKFKSASKLSLNNLLKQNNITINVI